MLQLTDSQKCAITISYVDAKGQPAPVNGAPVWISTAPTVAALTVATDGMSAEVVSGQAGVAQIQVTANGSFTDIPAPIAATLDVTVVGGQAVGATLTPGTPVAQ